MAEEERERACSAPSLPAPLSDTVHGYQWARDTIGQSGGSVYRLHGKAGAPDLYLKHGIASVADDVTDEMVRLRWLAAYGSVPSVKRFVSTEDQAWLLMTALRGQTAYQALVASPEDAPAIVDALAEALQRLHAIAVRECPFTSDHTLRLSRARRRIDAGLVETDEFDEARAGWTAEQVWDAMQALLPLTPDPVVTHGDFSLDNIILEAGRVVGFIDVGRVGIADRYQDLAILWNSLGEFDASLQERLFRRYGIAEPDERKLHFHLMLDEMF